MHLPSIHNVLRRIKDAHFSPGRSRMQALLPVLINVNTNIKNAVQALDVRFRPHGVRFLVWDSYSWFADLGECDAGLSSRW